MPVTIRREIAQTPSASAIATTDKVLLQQGAAGTAYTFGTVTQILNAGLAMTAANIALTGTAVPTNGLHLPAANTVGVAVNGTAAARFTATALSPAVSDAAALGTPTLPWSDIHLAVGAVINYNNGGITITHAPGTLTISSAIAVGGNVIQSRSATITAAGTSQATATTLTAQINIVTTVTAGQGVVLTDQDALVLNRGTVDLLVYPPSGGIIEAAGTNTAVALAANLGSGDFVRTAANTFRVA